MRKAPMVPAPATPEALSISPEERRPLGFALSPDAPSPNGLDVEEMPCCLEEHSRRKKVAREKLGAERAAAKEAADAAKAKARAEKMLAEAAARRAPRVAAPKAKTKPKAAPSFFRQGIAAAEVTDDEVEVEEEEGGAPTPMVVGAARATPDSERPRSVRKARAPCRFVDAAAEDEDGVEDEEVPYPPPLTLTLTLTPKH